MGRPLNILVIANLAKPCWPTTTAIRLKPADIASGTHWLRIQTCSSSLIDSKRAVSLTKQSDFFSRRVSSAVIKAPWNSLCDANPFHSATTHAHSASQRIESHCVSVRVSFAGLGVILGGLYTAGSRLAVIVAKRRDRNALVVRLVSN